MGGEHSLFDSVSSKFVETCTVSWGMASLGPREPEGSAEAPRVTHAPRGVRGVVRRHLHWISLSRCGLLLRAVLASPMPCTRSGVRSPRTGAAGMGPRSICPAPAPTATAGPVAPGWIMAQAPKLSPDFPPVPPGPQRSRLCSVSGFTVFARLAPLCLSPPRPVLTLPGWLLRCPPRPPSLLPAPAGRPAKQVG